MKSITPNYKNRKLPPEKRVRDLLARMTLEEKVAQMMCVWQEKSTKLVDASGNFDFVKARAAFKKGNGIGQVGRPSDAGSKPTDAGVGKNPRETAELTNAIQKFFIENSRLGIPVMFHEECLHGHAAIGATSFPQPIGLGGTFNPSLVEELYAVTARETAARGAHQALTPVVDVARDPRWGRVEETFGEDPYLVSQLGQAAVRGFQGDTTFRGKDKLIATLKHFAAHGQPESGQNCAPVNVSERLLRETFLQPFKDCLQKAGAISVMASYNEIDGVPSHASQWLLRDVLRKEWGFKGYVVSDYYAIWELHHRPDTHGHFVAHDKKEAAALAVKAGVNIELPDPDCYLHLIELVRKNVLEESQLDELIAPMLLWKFKLGLFEYPYVNPAQTEQIVGCAGHAQLARRAAREVITLLKNENALLPLNPAKLKTLAVIGPNAHRPLLGGYSGVPPHNVTVLDGIRARLGRSVKVLHAEGCKITVGGSWNQDAVTPSDPAEDAKQIAAAVKVATKADVIILAIGGNEQTEREAWARNHPGDRTSLDLFGRQEDLVRAMVATGKPVVALVFNGRPISINYVAQNVPAILECWYLGQESGHAVADVLFGDHNPGGKLPISIPRSVGQLPVFYNYKPSARRGYLLDETTPLYPFGFGLSYTQFSFKNVRLSKARIRLGGSARVLVDVTNAGHRAGTEVVQLYIRDCVSSVTRPVKELKGFKKISLAAGKTQTVEMNVSAESLGFWDLKSKHITDLASLKKKGNPGRHDGFLSGETVVMNRINYVVEPGDFEVMVGNSSRDEDLQRVILKVTK